MRTAIPKQSGTRRADGDDPGSIRIINASSLKRLPAVVRDLSAALKESNFQEGLLLDKTGFSVYLYDVICNRFENSAAIQYNASDTIYYLKLNEFNQKATDKSLQD